LSFQTELIQQIEKMQRYTDWSGSLTEINKGRNRNRTGNFSSSMLATLNKKKYSPPYISLLIDEPIV
jgi:hypothetical protein